MEATIDSSSNNNNSNDSNDSNNNNNNNNNSSSNNNNKTKSSNNDDSLLPIYRDKTVSFGEWDRIRNFFDENGYVVVTDVLTPEEVEEALEDLWTNPRLLGQPDIDRNVPPTWSSKSWPQSDGGKNFLDSNDVFQDRAAWDLTAHPKVVEVQRFLYKCDDLMKDNFGRWGVMRPTAENPEWKTESSWLHWDQHPWTEPDFIRLQAIVCLTNNTPTSGGFACVPGFHRQFLEWGQAHPMGNVKSKSGVTLDEGYGVNQPFPIPAEDPCQQRVIRVLAPSGSMVIWDSRLPHQNFPNTDAAEMRIVHYCMLKIKEETEAGILRNMLRKKMIVMETLGTKGPRFPDNLSPLARDIYCLSDAPDVRGSDDLSVSDNLKAAIPLVYQAGEAEDRGDVQLAIQYHSRALRIYPDIENWYDAILG